MFLISKSWCRGKLDPGVCMTSVLAKRISLRRADFRRIPSLRHPKTYLCRLRHRDCAAAFSLQVPKSCTHIDQAFLYISVLRSYSNFLPKHSGCQWAGPLSTMFSKGPKLPQNFHSGFFPSLGWSGSTRGGRQTKDCSQTWSFGFQFRLGKHFWDERGLAFYYLKNRFLEYLPNIWRDMVWYPNAPITGLLKEDNNLESSLYCAWGQLCTIIRGRERADQ